MALLLAQRTQTATSTQTSLLLSLSRRQQSEQCHSFKYSRITNISFTPFNFAGSRLPNPSSSPDSSQRQMSRLTSKSACASTHLCRPVRHSSPSHRIFDSRLTHSLADLIAAQVNAQVKADIAAAITASASLTNNLTPLGLAGIYGQVSIDVDAPVTDVSTLPIAMHHFMLTLPRSQVDTCDCPANAIPTCTNGQCGCTQCPLGQVYNPSTGGCSPSPSTVPRRRSLSATDAKAIAARQAHREDVVKRQGGKKVVA